ncbi:MAG TPA: sugar transferase [Candidatus Saccharimonadales bacterium]|nr:sugar transferase [Candidatus Saccharimonadales bacterium]
MNERWSQIYRLLLVGGDFFVLVLAFTVAYILRVKVSHAPLAAHVYALQYLRLTLALLPFWLILFAFLGLYTKPVFENRMSQAVRLLVGSIVGILFVIGYQYFSEQAVFPAHIVPVYATLIGFALLLIEREIMGIVRTTVFRYGWGLTHVMLIGDGEATQELGVVLSDSRHTGHKIEATVGNKQYFLRHGVKHFRSLTRALAEIDHLGIDTIIQTEWYNDKTNTLILQTAQQEHIAYKFIPTHSEFYTSSNSVELYHGLPAVSVRPTPLNGWGRIAKRLFDTVASFIGLIVLSPVFLLIALAIKLNDGGPVFYTQKRVTRFGHRFDFYKFRSMTPRYSGMSDIEAFRKMDRPDLIEELEKYRKVENDPRVTKVGRFLRRTSLDELPQLWNVLKGEMSLVGPRAFMPQEIVHYKTSPLLFSVRTGITGLWQVSGRNSLTFEQRIELELYYVQNWSFWLDMLILIKTVRVVFTKSGVLR